MTAPRARLWQGAEGVLGQPPGQRAQGPYMWSTRDNVEGKAGDPRNRLGGGGGLRREGKSNSVEGLKQLEGSGGFLRTGILST